jgi:uncharacterized membrane protein
MPHYDVDTLHDLSRRAYIAWNLLLACAILILPVVILLPLAYTWRGRADRTVFASHFRSVIRYGWIIFLTPLIIALSPSGVFGVAVALVVMFIVALAAFAGRKAVSHGMRYEGIFA